MLNDLLLLSGNDIPYESAQLVIHQPTIKEIAYIGEECFYMGCEFLKFTKDKINEEDRVNLENYTNFEIIMSIMKEKNIVMQKNRISVMMVLSLLFPTYRISLEDNYISLKQKVEDKEEEYQINKTNYDDFLNILNEMFCLTGDDSVTSGDINPSGIAAQRIAEKLRKRHQKLAEEHKESQKISVLSRYTSILAVGEQKDINSLLNYTVYQLLDEFKRFELKINFDIYMQARMAGAKDLKEVDDWMKDIHP